MNTSTSYWRNQFTRANEHLKGQRERWYARERFALHSRIQGGRYNALSEVADQAVQRGLYSPKTNRCLVRRAILKRLWREVAAPGVSWEEYSSPVWADRDAQRRDRHAA